MELHCFRFHVEINAVRRADIDTLLTLGAFCAVQATASFPPRSLFAQHTFIRFKTLNALTGWANRQGDRSYTYPIFGPIKDWQHLIIRNMVGIIGRYNILDYLGLLSTALSRLRMNTLGWKIYCYGRMAKGD